MKSISVTFCITTIIIDYPGYFRVFQIDPSNGDNRFIAGTTEEDFITPYSLDAKLRALILQGIKYPRDYSTFPFCV